MILLLAATDWPEKKMIFAEGIATGHATFEAEPPTWERFDSGKVAHSRFVAVEANGEILGWVAASAVSLRDVYFRVSLGTPCTSRSHANSGVVHFASTEESRRFDVIPNAPRGRVRAECLDPFQEGKYHA